MKYLSEIKTELSYLKIIWTSNSADLMNIGDIIIIIKTYVLSNGRKRSLYYFFASFVDVINNSLK